MSDTFKTSIHRRLGEQINRFYDDRYPLRRDPDMRKAKIRYFAPDHAQVEPLFRVQERGGVRYGNPRKARATLKIIIRRLDRRQRQREIEVE